jgi:hypothetical protein
MDFTFSKHYKLDLWELNLGLDEGLDQIDLATCLSGFQIDKGMVMSLDLSQNQLERKFQENQLLDWDGH